MRELQNSLIIDSSTLPNLWKTALMWLMMIVLQSPFSLSSSYEMTAHAQSD